MATPLDDILVPKVIDLINKFGISVDFIEKTSKTYDRATGAGGDTPAPHTVKSSPAVDVDDSYIDNDLVRQGDSVIYLASDIPFTPVKGIKATIYGIVWKTVKVRPLYSGDLIAAWELILRR